MGKELESVKTGIAAFVDQVLWQLAEDRREAQEGVARMAAEARQQKQLAQRRLDRLKEDVLRDQMLANSRALLLR